MKTRHIAAAALLAGALGTVDIAATPAASAAAPASTTCNLEIGFTHQSGSQIVGYGSLSNCPSRTTTARLTIQRYNGFQWRDGSSATVHGGGYDQYVYHSCAGSGWQSWRTIISGVDGAGVYHVKASNEIRVHC
jgi:hypothetical protein